MESFTASRTEHESTLDLSELARIQKGDQVRVEQLDDRTQELFRRTIRLLPPTEVGQPSDESVEGPERKEHFLPGNEDLRKIYLFAEALGGYRALDDIMSAYSPGNTLSRRLRNLGEQPTLKLEEVRMLEDHHTEITEALKNAGQFLSQQEIEQFSLEEIEELHALLTTASERAKDINRILGEHLMREIEKAVQRLNGYMGKIRSVERTVSGIFMVDSEVMFLPTNELIETVNTLFRGLGNPYLAANVDGVMLLAARNLLIEVVSFYSYYGKYQIYNLFQKGGGAVSLNAITQRIRSEIHQLFRACKAGNKLVLTRVMENAERDFELSVDAIQAAAEESAVAAVKVLIPMEEPAPVEKKKKSWLGRLFSWFKSRT